MHFSSRTGSLIATLAVVVLCVGTALGQTSFRMDKKAGHYSITTTVNDVPDTEIMLSSGSRDILIGQERFDRLFAGAQLDTVDAGREQINFDGNSRKLLKAMRGTLRMGDLAYTGNIFVVDGYGQVNVPILLFKNQADSTANLLRFNFDKKTLDFIAHDDETARMESFQIIDYARGPVFETTMELSDTYGHDGEISGKMMFAIGSGTPVFLYRKTIAPFLKEHGFRILKATDKSSNPAGVGLYAGYCKIGNRVLTGISVGITNQLWIRDVLGCVGPSFFDGNVIIDPENLRIYYKK